MMWGDITEHHNGVLTEMGPAPILLRQLGDTTRETHCSNNYGGIAVMAKDLQLTKADPWTRANHSQKFPVNIITQIAQN